MASVEFILKGQAYQITCDEGEEAHIQRLAEHLNERLRELSGAFSTASENLIMALLALTMEDELQNLKRQLAQHMGDSSVESFSDEKNNAIAAVIEEIASDVEALVKKVETS